MDRKELVNTREYQIAKASTEYYYAHKDSDEFDLIDAFEAGVLWADQHPEPSRGVLLLKTDVPVEIPTDFTIGETERELIRKALEKANGNRKVAAEILGIAERTIYRKMKAYNL